MRRQTPTGGSSPPVGEKRFTYLPFQRNRVAQNQTVTNAAYTVADLTLHWKLGALTPYAKIENLTNTRYQEVFGFPSPTRRALLGIRYSVAR